VCAWLKQHVLQLDDKLVVDRDEERICRKIASEVLLYASIVPLMEQQMSKRNLWTYYITVEMPALTIILQMLLNGILIDREELIRQRENLLVISFMSSVFSVLSIGLDPDESTGTASLSIGQTSFQTQPSERSDQGR
jgi:hypothetical protein